MPEPHAGIDGHPGQQQYRELSVEDQATDNPEQMAKPLWKKIVREGFDQDVILLFQHVGYRPPH
jgi:hypothetical protein